MRRRPLTGQPLLMASAGLVALAGCPKGPDKEPPMGNLMPPPQQEYTELCIEVTPDEATITLDGATAAEGCTPLLLDPPRKVHVEISAPQHVPHSFDLEVGRTMEPVVIALTPEEAVRPDMAPVGNLMPPPQPQ